MKILFIADQVLIFEIEGGRLTGTQGAIPMRNGSQKLVSDLPELSVSGTTITWMSKMKISEGQGPDTELDILNKVSLVGDDKMLFEKSGKREAVDNNGRRLGSAVQVHFDLKIEK